MTEKKFEITWFEQLIRTSMVYAKDKEDALRKWRRGDPGAWDLETE